MTYGKLSQYATSLLAALITSTLFVPQRSGRPVS